MQGGFFMVINLKKLIGQKQFVYGLIGLFIFSTAYVQVANLVNTGPIAIAGTNTEQKVVALTFDHSWGNKFTPSILETLRANDVKATFFIMGPWALKYPEVAKQIATDGHEIASHGHKHENYGDRTADWVKNDIEKAEAEIKEATGVESVSLVRPPNGSYSKEALSVIDSLGYKTIIWNIDSLDWKNPGRDVVIDRVVKRLKPGGIILMHASDTPQQTAEALPILLEKIKAEGYQIVTVGELLQNYAEGGLKRH